MNQPARPRLGGFQFATLLVAIASIAAAFTAPRIRDHVFRSRAESVAADLRAFAAAFQAQAAQAGDWPGGDGDPGAFPPGMEQRLAATRWAGRPAIGGRYAWDPGSTHQGTRIRAAIVITGTSDQPVTRDVRPLQLIDRLLDDGNLRSGNFLIGYRNEPVFVLEH